MSSRVCGACGGDDPDCLVCKGTGVDPPPSKITENVVTPEMAADNEITTEKIAAGDPPDVYKLVGILEGRIDAAQELTDEKIYLMISTFRMWLHKTAVALTAVVSFSAVGAFLLAHYDAVSALPGAFLMFVLSAALGMTATLYVLNLKPPGPLQPDD